MDEEQRQLEELIRKMQDASASSEDFARANKAAENALTRFTKTTIGDVTKGVAAFSGSIMAGNRSFTTLNPTIDALGKAAAGLAKSFPVVGRMLGGAIEGATAGFKFLTERLDDTLQSFQQVGQAGAIGQEGMEGFRMMAAQSMMTLGQFTDAVDANSKVLALFRGSTFAATQDFADAIGEIAGPGGFARRLGRSTSDIAETVGRFIEIQTTQGRQQLFTGDALQRGTEQYILDLDKLARLTGQSAKELQDQQLALMLDQQFAAFTGNMGEQGQLLAQFVSSTGPLADGFKDIIATGGAATTDAGRQLQVLLGGAANDIANSLRSADDIPGAIARVRSILDANLEIPRTAAAAGVQNFLTDNFGAIQQFARGLTLSNEELEVSRQKQLAGTDGLINSMTSAAIQMDNFNLKVEETFIQTGLPMVSDALQSLTKILSDAMTEIAKVIERFKNASPDDNEFKKFMNSIDPDNEVLDAMKGTKMRTGTALAGAGFGGAAGVKIGGLLGMMFGPLGVAAGTGIGGILGGLLGGGLGLFAPEILEKLMNTEKRYMGGPVTAGMPYIVGERGAEAFVPDRDGTVIPNNLLAGPMTGFNAMDVPAPQPAQEVTIPASVTRTQESQGNAQMEMMQTQINKLDEMIRLMGRQITATDKVRTAVS